MSSQICNRLTRGVVSLRTSARAWLRIGTYTGLPGFMRADLSVTKKGGIWSYELLRSEVAQVMCALHLRTRQVPDGFVEISVKDTGEGMAPDVARRALEPFFTTKPAGKGTGLGLSMTYGTVTAHGGTLEIKSAPGEGTEILLVFPASTVPTLEPPLEPPALERAPGGPMDILLVDDDELIRDSVTPMLEMLGHHVRTASTGQEALDRFADGLNVDLVILDMNMPGLTGAETLPRLLELRPGQAVLMASGYSDQGIAPLLMGRPNVASLRKPFTLKELEVKLEIMGAHSRAGRPPEAPGLSNS